MKLDSFPLILINEKNEQKWRIIKDYYKCYKCLLNCEI